MFDHRLINQLGVQPPALGMLRARDSLLHYYGLSLTFLAPGASPPSLSPSPTPLCRNRSCELANTFPMSSMWRKVNGKITLQATVEIDGTVSNVVVVRALDPERLDPAAVKALRQWRFVAGHLDGKAIPMIITVDMAFTLQ